MDLTGLLNDALSGDTVSQISQAIGADESTTSNAIQTALPALLGGLANNSASEDGAASLAGALSRDHDGSILDNLGGLIGGALGGNAANGEGILGHIFGGQHENVAQGVSQASGLDMSKVGPLLAILAPIVMGAVSRAHQSRGGDSSGMAGMLGGAISFLLPSAAALDQLYAPLPPFKPGEWALFAVMFVSVCSYTLYFDLLRRLGAVFVSQASYAVALSGLCWGWLFFGETIGLGVALSAALIFVGLYLVNRRPARAD